MKIAVAQMKSAKGDVDKNITAHCRFVNAAVNYKADAIFFPELSLTGYEPALAKETATTPDDNRLAIFQSLCDEHNIVTGIGLPTISEAGICISMIVFQPQMQRKIYSKQYLHDEELPYFVPGTEQLYITIEKSKIAFAICYESLLGQHAERVSHDRVDVYLASVAKSANGVAKAYQHYPHIAKAHSMFVLMANCISYCDNFEGAGFSAAWNRKGWLEGRLDENSEGILIFDTETGRATTVLQTGHTSI